MDFENYLLNELYDIVGELGLDIKLHVAEYRSFKMPDDHSDLLFVIRYITGSYVGNIKTQPVQIFCYSELDDIQSAYLIMDSFSKKHNNLQFMQDNEMIKMNFETPVSMRNFIQSEVGYRASVYCFGTFIVCENIDDIKTLQLKTGNGASDIPININYLSASFGYAAVLNTTKISGQALSKSMKQEAGLTLTITLMSVNDNFCSLIKGIMYGESSGNRDFTFIVTETTNDTPIEITMKLESVTKPSEKQAAPVLTLTFRR